jgi:predicted amidohydrolase YtcJ
MRERDVAVLGGSDFPIESPDPLPGLRAFHFREPSPGSGAWYGDERISCADALDAYTAWAPLGIPRFPRRGRLLPGYDADIVVMSGDPFDDPAARALITIVAGRVVWREE